MNSLIYKDYFYTASTASLEYYIVADGRIIFRGKSWRNPDTGLVKINVGDIVRDYMKFDLPDFRPLDDVVTRQEDAYKVFELYGADGVKIDEYKVLFDWHGEWNGEQKVLSNPIDGILDPRMKILWTIFGPAAFDVIMESGPLTIDSFFRLLTTNIVLGQEGGEYNIRWLTDYMPSSEWTVTIDGLTGFDYHDANLSGITIDFPRNDTVSAFTYDIYYHIHGLTFGPTHMTHNGGTLDIDRNPIDGGSNSGDTEHTDWESSFPVSSITYSADTWIEVTNITSEGCDITFKESNMSLEPRTEEYDAADNVPAKRRRIRDNLGNGYPVRCAYGFYGFGRFYAVRFATARRYRGYDGYQYELRICHRERFGIFRYDAAWHDGNQAGWNVFQPH